MVELNFTTFLNI